MTLNLDAFEEAEAPGGGGSDGLQGNGGGVEGEGDSEGELGVHEEGLGGGRLPRRQLLLDLTDEADGDSLLKLIHRRVQVEDLDDLQQERTGWGS